VIILRLAVTSALIYVGFALAVEVALFSLAKMTGGSSLVMASKLGWFIFFGVFWLVSFWIAFRMSPFSH
jgi:hypothetical protein